MNAVEIRNLSKNYGPKQAVCGLNMTVPMGAIYGFIGENGSGKSTTEKMICGLIPTSGGSIKLYDRDYTDPAVRAKVGVLIEAPGCFPGLSVWDNMMLQAANLDIPDAEKEIVKILKLVRVEGAAGNKYKNCSLGMKQRIGIAMALLGNPTLLVLDAVYILYYIGVAGGATNQELIDQGATVAFSNIFGGVLGNILKLFIAISCFGTVNGHNFFCGRTIPIR